MRVLIEKALRRLTVFSDGGEPVLSCPVALGSDPAAPKRREGDGRTPEGRFYICIVKPEGRWGRSLGLSYPTPEDGEEALREGVIDARALEAIRAAHRERRRPPWGTALGGEIYLHEGGTASDWTKGCIAVDSESMNGIFPLRDRITEVEIKP